MMMIRLHFGPQDDTGGDPHNDPTRIGFAAGHEDTRRMSPSGQLPSSAAIPSPQFDGKIPAPSLDARIGQALGPYVVEKVLARGGMGVVYLAVDLGLSRKVALKLMLKDALADGDAAARFQREARATASLAHPNIASVYMVGLAEDGSPYLAMEFVDGGSLLEVIRKRTPVGYSQAADWMAQAAEGLRAAHKQGIIHRDIKPGNMMVSTTGVLKLVDFGLAKVMFDDNYRTVEGTVLGTPKYMSPEQGQGRQLDFKSDIYSLGATFYHILTGRPPFEADTPVQVLFKHATAQLVPMRSIVPTIPIEWDTVVARCMRKDPNDRYEHYEDLIGDLRTLRLQTMAQEQGPVIGADGTNSYSHSAHSTGSIPSLPSLPSLHDVSGVRPSAEPLLTPITYEAAPPIPTMYKIGFGIAAVFVLALATHAAMTISEGSDDELASGGEDGTSYLPLLIERVLKEPASRERKDDPDYIAFRSTQLILSEFHGAIRTYASTEGSPPGNLTILVENDLVEKIFDSDSETAEPLDGWRQRLIYSSYRKEVRSPGIDKLPNTEDDIYIEEDGRVIIPDIYSVYTNSL
jgi:serine/threonine protein kinase